MIVVGTSNGRVYTVCIEHTEDDAEDIDAGFDGGENAGHEIQFQKTCVFENYEG